MRTLNQRRAAIILYLAAAVLVSIGLIGMLFRNHAGGFYMIAFVVAVFVGVRHMIRIELWDTGRLLSRKRAPLRQAVILPLYIVTDVVILLFAWITARFFAGLAVDRQAFMYNLPVVAGIFFVALVVSRTYMRVWSRATIRDYVVLTVTLLIASVFSVGVMFLTENDTSGFVMFMFVMFMSAFFPIVGVRVLRECVNGIVHVIERMVIMDKPGVDLVIVIGGGVKFSLFLRELISRAGENKTVIAGLLDEDLNLHGRIIAGYRVLGGLDMLSTLVSNTGAQRVLITCEMEDEKLKAVAAMLKDAEVELCRWCISEARCETSV